MKRCLNVLWVVLAWLSLMGPAVAEPRCDACAKRIDSLAEPVKLAGTWLFTREDRPENALPATDTAAWKTVRAPGPWKKAYDDGQVYGVGWYRGEFVVAPALVGKEVVLTLNTYMAPMQVFVNGQRVYARPHDQNVERYFSIQAAPVRFVLPQENVTLAIRVETPLMTGVYQLPFDLRAYDAQDHSLTGWAVFGGELRVTVGWVALFFGLFFLLVYAKVKYSMYLVAALATILGWFFLAAPADYFVALFGARTITFVHYLGLYGVFFLFLFSQYFYKFTPRANKVVAVLLALPLLGIASMLVRENLALFQSLRSVMFLVMLAVAMTSVYFYLRGMLARQHGAGIMFVGMLLFTVMSVNDTLLGLGLIQSVSLGATGLSLCIAAMLFVASRRFSDTFVENKRLVRDLTNINENLEGLVSERTAALREKTNDIQSMLQNMPQGVMTLQAGSRIHPEYSAYLETIFETQQVADREAMDFVFGKSDLGADARSQVEVALASVIGEDAMNWEFNAHLLVSECAIHTPSGQRKSLDLSWSPILAEDGTVEKLMLCVRDVTELKRLAAEAAGQKRELELIGEVLRVSQEKFQAFIESALGFLAENRQVLQTQQGRSGEAVNLLFRNMHTIKGNARTYGFLYMTNTVHEAESAYDQLRKDADAPWDAPALLAQLDAVEALVREYAKINDQTLGRKGPGRRGNVEKFLMVDRSQLGNALRQLEGLDRTDMAAMKAAVEGVQTTLRRMGTEPLSETLSALVDGLPPLARELGKEPPKVHFDEGGTRVKSQLADLLRNLFTHLLRNSVDHGLESAAERAQAGKTAAGHIHVRAALDAESYSLRLHDDGRGLALGRIRERALQRGLVEPDQPLSDQQAAELVFLPGFSTAEVVTDVSGRGVGMDAVRDFLQRENGRISVQLTGGREGDAYRAAEWLIELPAAAAVQG